MAELSREQGNGKGSFDKEQLEKLADGIWLPCLRRNTRIENSYLLLRRLEEHNLKVKAVEFRLHFLRGIMSGGASFRNESQNKENH